MRIPPYKTIAFAVALGLTSSAGALASNLPPQLTGITPLATGASITVTEAFTDCVAITVRGSVTFTATDDEDGSGNDFVWLSIWDDGELKADWSTGLPVGTTETVPFEIIYGDPTVGQDAPGIGVYLYDLPNDVNLLFDIDPQDVEGEETCGGPIPPPPPAPAVAVPLGGPASIGLMGLLLGMVGLGWMRRRSDS